MSAIWEKVYSSFTWTYDDFRSRINKYRFSISPLVEPFLRRFGLEKHIWDVSLDITFDEFQELILFCEDYEKFDNYLEENWYKLLWKKKCKYKIKKEWQVYSFSEYEESWTDLNTKKLIKKAIKWEAFFWFLPYFKNDNEVILIFAEKKDIVGGYVDLKTAEQIHNCLNS